MSWRQNPLEILEWLLRLSARAIWALIAIVLSLFALYLTVRIVFHLADFFNRTIFYGPW